MREFFFSLVMFSMTMSCFAVPAKRGLWKTLRLADGRELKARLQGDDMVHYYQAASGECYVGDATGIYKPVDKAELTACAKARRVVFDKSLRARARKRVGGTGNVYEGKKKGLIIIVQFADMPFKTGHDLGFYKRLANEHGFSTPDGFHGSVRDYFIDQSRGMLTVDFDVVGPLTMPNPYSYYGQNAGIAGDAHVGELVAEACRTIDGIVDFADYDWDGDGEVDQVFVLYSGLGENAGGSPDTIWPHMWTLRDNDYGKTLELDNVVINTYACSCETVLDYADDSKEVVDGIGTICHEFSHCLGYPDMYDTSQYGQANFGMDMWDLMDYGSYNNGGFTPSGYTAYEKWVAGWIKPIELTEDTRVTGLKPTSEGGQAYIIYNSGNNDEFLLLENRSQTGWDAAQMASGLMVMHVDYDAKAWYDNTVNNDADRQRCTIFHADNSDGIAPDDIAGDLYPFGDNNSLNSISFPKPMWYAMDAAGHRSLGRSISDMALAPDGTVEFRFSAKPVEREAFLLLETFDESFSMGGNDNIWTAYGDVDLVTDNYGWTGVEQHAGAQCARFGTKSTPGMLVSPELAAQEDAVLTCLAGPWSGEECTMTVSFIESQSGRETVLGTFDLVDSSWKKCEMKLGVSAAGKLRFASSSRQFLDEVRVSKPVADGIGNIVSAKEKVPDKRVYSIDGRYLGDDLSKMGRGLYIVGGRKVVK